MVQNELWIINVENILSAQCIFDVKLVGWVSGYAEMFQALVKLIKPLKQTIVRVKWFNALISIKRRHYYFTNENHLQNNAKYFSPINIQCISIFVHETWIMNHEQLNWVSSVDFNLKLFGQRTLSMRSVEM